MIIVAVYIYFYWIFFWIYAYFSMFFFHCFSWFVLLLSMLLVLARLVFMVYSYCPVFVLRFYLVYFFTYMFLDILFVYFVCFLCLFIAYCFLNSLLIVLSFSQLRFCSCVFCSRNRKHFQYLCVFLGIWKFGVYFIAKLCFLSTFRSFLPLWLFIY